MQMHLHVHACVCCSFIELNTLRSSPLSLTHTHVATGDAMRGSHYPQQWHGSDTAGLNGNMAAMLQQLQQHQHQQFMQQRRLHQQQVVHCD